MSAWLVEVPYNLQNSQTFLKWHSRLMRTTCTCMYYKTLKYIHVERGVTSFPQQVILFVFAVSTEKFVSFVNFHLDQEFAISIVSVED